jgi:hypothetical protein
MTEVIGSMYRNYMDRLQTPSPNVMDFMHRLAGNAIRAMEAEAMPKMTPREAAGKLGILPIGVPLLTADQHILELLHTHGLPEDASLRMVHEAARGLWDDTDAAKRRVVTELTLGLTMTEERLRDTDDVYATTAYGVIRFAESFDQAWPLLAGLRIEVAPGTRLDEINPVASPPQPT